MKFPNFNSILLFVAFISLSTISCKKDISFDDPNADGESIRNQVRQNYADSSIGFCDVYQKRDSIVEPGHWNNFYNLSTTGSATKMPYAKVLISFTIPTGQDSVLGRGISLNETFAKELAWEDFKSLPNNVSHLIYDYNGNSIWFTINTLSIQSKNADMIQFVGSSVVVGGTGIYSRAKGELNMEIKIDLHDAGKNSIRQQGVIVL